MSSFQRVGTKEVGKTRIGYAYLEEIFMMANAKKFNRFELAQFTATSDIFSFSWVEVFEKKYYLRNMEHWDAEILYNALKKMYKDSDYVCVEMDLAFDEAAVEKYGEKKLIVEDNGEDLL